MKQVREISTAWAFVVLNKKGKHVANVEFNRGSGGAVQCDVWCMNTYTLSHQRKAGGYGYDKQTAALSGAVIDGYTMADHCGKVEQETMRKVDRLFKRYQKAAALGLSYDQTRLFWEPKFKAFGFDMANYRDGAWGNVFPISGLDRLSALGYRVIRVL